MIVMQITRVRLHPDAGAWLTANEYREADEWLTQWTPRANFKAAAADTRQRAFHLLREDLRKNLQPERHWSNVKSHHFQFMVSEQEAEDGRFWMPSGITSGTWHDIPKDYP